MQRLPDFASVARCKRIGQQVKSIIPLALKYLEEVLCPDKFPNFQRAYNGSRPHNYNYILSSATSVSAVIVFTVI